MVDGCWLLVVGCWLLVVCCWLWSLVVGCWLLNACVCPQYIMHLSGTLSDCHPAKILETWDRADFLACSQPLTFCLDLTTSA